MVETLKKPGDSIIPDKITMDQSKDTGMALVLIGLLIGLISQSNIWVVLAIILLVLNMIYPSSYRPAAKAWIALSRLLGTIVSKILMSLVFFLIVTPVGLVRKKLLGADAMRLKEFKKGNGSVFKVRNKTFEDKDIMNPY